MTQPASVEAQTTTQETQEAPKSPSPIPAAVPAAEAPNPLYAAIAAEVEDFDPKDLLEFPLTQIFIDIRGAKWQTGERVPYPKDVDFKISHIFRDDEDVVTIYAAPARYMLDGKRLSVEVFQLESAFIEALAAEYIELLGDDDDDSELDPGLEESRKAMHAAIESAKTVNAFINSGLSGKEKLALEAMRVRLHNRAVDAITDFDEELKIEEQLQAEAAALENEASGGDGGGDAPANPDGASTN
jgi:hypothetical protein